MSDKIAAIRARHEIDDRYRGWHPGAHKDRATLLAEVERLTRERDEARAEVERLREEMQKIRERLYLAAGHAAAAALLSEEAHRKALEAKP